MCISYCESVSVDLHTQHSMGMRPIIISPVARLALSFFLHYLKNGTIFGKTLLNTNLCSDFIYNFETFLIARRVLRNIITHVHRSSCETPVIVVRF